MPAAFVVLGLSFTTASQANEYALEYSVKGRYQHTDNINLQPDFPIDLSGAEMILPATLTASSERLQASLLGSLSSSKYNESGYDSTDSNLQASADYRLERGTISGRAGYQRDSTQNTEFLDTGVVGFQSSRVEYATVGSSGTYNLTELNSLTAGANYRKSEYESPRFVNNENTSGYIGWIHQWTEDTNLQLQGTVSRFENEARIQVVSDSYGVQGGFTSNLTERLNVSALGGWTTTKTSYSASGLASLPDDDNTGGWVFNGSTNYQMNRSKLSANLVRSSVASGNGYLQVSTILNIEYLYDVSEKSRLTLGLTSGRNGALDSRIKNNRDFSRANVALSYQFSRSWSLVGTYVYSYQDRESQTESADSNTLYATLIFQPLRTIWSR